MPAAICDPGNTGIETAEAGTTVYCVNEQPVTVTVEESVSGIVDFELPENLEHPVTVTLAPVENPAAASGYSLGPEASSPVAVDVSVSRGGLSELCLDVTQGLRDAAAGRTLISVAQRGAAGEGIAPR